MMTAMRTALPAFVLGLLVLLVLAASPLPAADPAAYLSTSTSTFALRYTLRDADHLGDVLSMLEQSYQRISREFALYPLQTFTVFW